MAGDAVRVDPMGLVHYGEAVVTAVASAQGQTTKPILGISQNAIAAFGTSAGEAGTFAEGVTALSVINRNMQDLHAFLTDVATGMQAIDSATNAMAVVYATTDADQANSLNSVDFAFADSVTPPTGFPKAGVSTMSDQQAAAEAASGQNTNAAIAAQDASFLQYATATTVVPGGLAYTFADGSKLEVVNTNASSGYISQESTTTSIYRPGEAQPATISTQGTSYDYAGQKTTSSSTQTLTTDSKYTSSGQSTTMEDNGDVSVTTSTDDGSGHVSTETNDVTPAKPDPSTETQGAIQQYETQYHADGSDEYMKYGRS